MRAMCFNIETAAWHVAAFCEPKAAISAGEPGQKVLHALRAMKPSVLQRVSLISLLLGVASRLKRLLRRASTGSSGFPVLSESKSRTSLRFKVCAPMNRSSVVLP